MLKLLGSLLILGAGFMARTFQVQTSRRELNVLRDLISSFDEMGNEIRWNRTPLPRLMQKVGREREEDVTDFFKSVGEAISFGEPLPSAWRSAAVSLPIAMGGQAEVAELGKKLCGDEEQACKGISFLTHCLSRRLEEKRSHQADFEKRSTALCFSGAALLIILLI